MLGHPNLVPTTGFAAPMSALIHLSERWSIFGISTLRYSRGPPTYSNTLNDARTLSTVPLALEIGVSSIVRWKQHRTNGVLSSDQRRGYHKQTSQDALTSGHSHQPKLVTGLEMLTFLSWAPHRISLCSRCCCSYISSLPSPPFTP